ncbi:S1 family peptidase [Streptomyces tauricus]|uniref:S1 family peptidase n=1 Tax=Streptomyces tauricus TaxID=68274 RepID=A0ABZ1J9M9_9ACTN|nr:S1 family peptidase [Streptomyces tauricus]MCW8102511.1 S1 family peptidase [Streptomyces tauricus]
MRRLHTCLAMLTTAVTAVVTLFFGTVSSATALQLTTIRGGTMLYAATGARCVVGFNATGNGVFYGVMVGHCSGTHTTTWYADAARTVQVGVTAGASYPIDDYGVVRYTSNTLNLPGDIALGGGVYQDITGVASPAIGQSLCHVGRTSGVHCGRVTAVNATVNYAEGAVHGLIRSTTCSEPGDTGAPAYSGTLAVGFLVGATGNCTSGGISYHQPVAEVMAHFGLTAY